MKNFLKKYVFVAAVAVAGFTSCKKMLDVQPQDQLDVTQMYRNVYDADAAIIGIYGKFQGLAERYILLNELRADMLDFTSNADEYLRQLRCSKDPVSIEIRSSKPSAGNEIKKRTIFSQRKQIAFGIAHPQQASTGNRNVLWLAIN